MIQKKKEADIQFQIIYSCCYKIEKKIILEKSSNQGPSPPNHVVTNNGKQDQRDGFKQRILSCIWQMFVHSFILLITLNWVYMCCNKAPAFNKTVHCTVYV